MRRHIKPLALSVSKGKQGRFFNSLTWWVKRGQRARLAPAKPAAQEEVVEAPEIISVRRPASRCLLAADRRASQKTW